MQSLKIQLHNLCCSYLTESICNAEAAIADAREAVQNETKSSAGDKYETAREMMQQDIDLNNARLLQLRRQIDVLDRIVIDTASDIIIPGSIVITSLGNYFIAISAGKLPVDGQTYYAISIDSPLGTQLKGKKAGDEFIINGKKGTIMGVL
ncbi:MAG: GreA/GreB family elongation factor [Flavipsychrobacter sp.]|nr:GreA/GreB family elongation factor [Flavipsychrobacter sp.]